MKPAFMEKGLFKPGKELLTSNQQLNLHISSLQIILFIRRSFVRPGVSFDWTRSQSGRTKNTKQNEEIKFQRE